MLQRAIIEGRLVRLSVRLSITLANHAYTVQDVEILFITYD